MKSIKRRFLKKLSFIKPSETRQDDEEDTASVVFTVVVSNSQVLRRLTFQRGNLGLALHTMTRHQIVGKGSVPSDERVTWDTTYPPQSVQ
ncbi:unnamed protein product [Dovyalis caffra]|uniref:Uncharacterized protein n=1 Tax=Dovyalis caffra TaxID=77055 RepID=A0AAV1S0Z3_9ROSI|nr:unnamed protein product [Dovyalis caffra]